MDDIPLSLLFGSLFVLLLCSAFFSGSETALMAINRYRVLHLAREGNRGAILAQKLLEHPDRLIGLILLGNNFVNILASMISGFAFVRLFGEYGPLVATVVLTAVVLIFAEVAPKTLAAFKPERVAMPASYILYPMLRTLYPVVRVINMAAGLVLRMVGYKRSENTDQALSQAELRTLLEEGGGLIPDGHRRMLLNILALEEARVEDIMVPRSEISGIDMDDSAEEITATLAAFPYSRALVYRGNVSQVLGTLNLRELVNLRQASKIDHALIEKHLRKPYFIPDSTRLPQQLLLFQRQQRLVRQLRVEPQHQLAAALAQATRMLELAQPGHEFAVRHVAAQVGGAEGAGAQAEGRTRGRDLVAVAPDIVLHEAQHADLAPAVRLDAGREREAGAQQFRFALAHVEAGDEVELLARGTQHRHRQAQSDRARGRLDVERVERVLDHLGPGQVGEHLQRRVAGADRHAV